MKNWIYILLLLPISIWGQVDSCEQFSKVIDYFETDTTFKEYYKNVKLKFHIGGKFDSGGIYPFMLHKYLVGKLGLEDEEQLYNQDTSIIYPMYRQLLREDYADTTEYYLNCLTDLGTKRKANIFVNFYRKDKNVLTVYTGMIFKKPRHTFGMIHLFFFNENNDIEKVFETTWIE